MTIWFISRHPGALHWMQSNHIHFDHHLTHLANEPIAKGDIVIGSLPVNLAADVCARGAQYWNLSLILPAEARGRELTADQLEQYQARLETFQITLDSTATAPLAETAEPTTPQPYLPHPSELWHWKDAIFKAFIFSRSDPARGEQQAAHLLEGYSRQVQGHPATLQQLETVLRQGRHAVQLATALDSRIKRSDSLPSLQSWIDAQKPNQANRIIRHLQITLDKAARFRQDKERQSQQNRHFNISLPYTQLDNGRHPQSLRFMQPAQEWDIYIDETGKTFSTEASELSDIDSRLGRIIALALPAGHQLAPLDKPVHAVDLNYVEIEKLLWNIIQSNSGILGATLKQDLHSHNWMAAVHQLIRWALLMLPMHKQGTRVRIHIEGREPYINDQQLQALQDTLNSELKSLLPARFQQLDLSLHIMDKANPYNGYVDVIANCWGSSDQTKRKLLSRTGWRSHCLLQSSHLARVEDLYRSISSGEQISGYNWFELSSACTREPEHSMLPDMLRQLGEQSQAQPEIWRDYLAEVQRRLEHKKFTPTSLQAALSWLEDWQQDEQQLPAYLQLELYSLQLANSNHQGGTHLQQVAKLLPLITQLTDEAPTAACQALLRIAVRSTHIYDFSSTLPLLQQWLAYPIAVPGLLNHAKLHSTIGQLSAFQGHQQQALESFDRALHSLERLSDQQQRELDQTQTRIYKAIVLQDMLHEEAITLTRQLAEQATQATDTRAIERLARSSSTLRFPHYLLLRLLISQPQLVTERAAYLSQQQDWRIEQGHPWPLIQTYRAWLLQSAQQQQAASEHLQIAIDDCLADEQPMLIWMGYCLHALGHSLGLSASLTKDAPGIAAQYPADQLKQLSNTSNDAQRLQQLQKLLPFNFH